MSGKHEDEIKTKRVKCFKYMRELAFVSFEINIIQLFKEV